MCPALRAGRRGRAARARPTVSFATTRSRWVSSTPERSTRSEPRRCRPPRSAMSAAIVRMTKTASPSHVEIHEASAIRPK